MIKTKDKDLEFLRTPCEHIVFIDGKLSDDDLEVATTIVDAVHKHDAAGMAANQVGHQKRIFGILEHSSNTVKIYINPVIIKFSGEKVRSTEGCFSCPGEKITIWRSKSVKVKYREIDGSSREHYIRGFSAILFQHELDHLDGVLMTDHPAA